MWYRGNIDPNLSIFRIKTIYYEKMIPYEFHYETLQIHQLNRKYENTYKY